MRILAIGDPHGKISKNLPNDIDLFLIPGDLGKSDLARGRAFENIERKKKNLPLIQATKKQEKREFMEVFLSSIKLLKSLAKKAPVYFIYGNVELTDSEIREISRESGIKLPLFAEEIKKIKGVRIINNHLVKFNGVKIGGLGYFLDKSWMKNFNPKDRGERWNDAKKETKQAERLLKKIGQVDILLCHQPPLGILDKVSAKFAPRHWQGKHAGSGAILNYIKKYHPRYVICGHIHESKGKAKIGRTEIYNLGVAGYKIIDLD
jgi:Icc-related predicted phosphoesterase